MLNGRTLLWGYRFGLEPGLTPGDSSTSGMGLSMEPHVEEREAITRVLVENRVLVFVDSE